MKALRTILLAPLVCLTGCLLSLLIVALAVGTLVAVLLGAALFSPLRWSLRAEEIVEVELSVSAPFDAVDQVVREVRRADPSVRGHSEVTVSVGSFAHSLVRFRFDGSRRGSFDAASAVRRAIDRLERAGAIAPGSVRVSGIRRSLTAGVTEAESEEEFPTSLPLEPSKR